MGSKERASERARGSSESARSERGGDEEKRTSERGTKEERSLHSAVAGRAEMLNTDTDAVGERQQMGHSLSSQVT